VGSGSRGACLSAHASRSAVYQLLQAQGNQACWLALSVTCGAVEALDSAYTGVLISMAFQGEGSMSCSRG
jgi:hypothetical protein